MERHVRLFVDARSRRRVLLGLVAVSLALFGLSWLLHERIAWLGDPVGIRQFVLGFGIFSPVVFVLLAALQVVIAPIPGQALALASGWLFGVVWGTVYSVVGATLGSYVALFLSRRYGRAFVERTIDPDTRARFDGLSAEHGYAVFTLFVLIPGIPDDVLCFVAGTTTLDIRRLTALAGVARIPTFLLLNAAGASLAASRYVEMAVILVVLLALSAVVYLNQDRIVSRLLSRQA